MARKDLELELLELRFKNYTSDVRQCISRVVLSERCEDTSDKVVDALWSTCHDDLVSLLAKNGFNDECYDEEGQWVPSAEAREFIRTFIDQARDYEAELGDLEDDDFEKLYRTIFEPIDKAKRDRRAQSARNKDRWDFFNKPEAEADFAHWCERLLSPAQAVALSFGKEPDIVTPERLKPFRRVGGSPFREAFKDRLDLIEAAVANGQLSVPMSVGALNRWAAERDIALPSALTSEPLGKDAAYWKAKYEAAQSELNNLRRGLEDLPPKSKISIYRLLLGMAAARFEYRTDQRTKATAAIKDGLESVELSMSEDAILANLKQAALAIDYSWTQPIHWAGIRRR